MTSRDDLKPTKAPWRRFGIAGAALAAALAVAGQAGAASTGLGSTQVSSQGTGTSTATCPKKKGVVAAGFEAPGFGSSDHGATVARIGSRRSDKRTVTTDAFNFGESDGPIISHAYCAKSGKKLNTASSSTSITPSAVGTATATCPKGTTAVSGGWEEPDFSKDSTQLLVFASELLGKASWQVEAFNIPPDTQGGAPRGAPGTLIAYVYCAKHGPKLNTASAQSTLTGTALQPVDAVCSKGKALSGGFDGHLQVGNDDVSAAVAVSSTKDAGGAGWSVLGFNVSGDSQRGPVATQTAFAYCKKPRKR